MGPRKHKKKIAREEEDGREEAQEHLRQVPVERAEEIGDRDSVCSQGMHSDHDGLQSLLALDLFLTHGFTTCSMCLVGGLSIGACLRPPTSDNPTPIQINAPVHQHPGTLLGLDFWNTCSK